jgi:hypothetical protein
MREEDKASGEHLLVFAGIGLAVIMALMAIFVG